MNKEMGTEIKKKLIWAVKNPLDAGFQMAMYIICMSLGIWIVGFALGFMLKVMNPIIEAL